MIFNDSVELKIPEPIIKPSVADSIALELKKQKQYLELSEFEENNRKESKIESRIIEDRDTSIIVKLWTDHTQYKINDKIRIVVECNKDFENEELKINFNKNSKNKLQLLNTRYVQAYDDGKELHYSIFIYKSLNTGIVKIHSFKVKIGKKELKTNTLRFRITKN
ncbi:MAG TPA: hypothetical protein VF677_07515 [Flavobacterium sp.]|jgi:hypothetical protein